MTHKLARYFVYRILKLLPLKFTVSKSPRTPLDLQQFKATRAHYGSLPACRAADSVVAVSVIGHRSTRTPRATCLHTLTQVIACSLSSLVYVLTHYLGGLLPPNS